MADVAIKRIRIRMKAHDALGLAKSFKSHLSKRGIFIKSGNQLPPGTRVVVELLYASGDRALYGEGNVTWARSDGPSTGSGMNIELEWDQPSQALVDQVLAAPILARPPPRPPSSARVPPRRPPSVPSPGAPRAEAVRPRGSEPPPVAAPRAPMADDEARTEVADVAAVLREADSPDASQAGVQIAMDSLPPASLATAAGIDSIPIGEPIDPIEPITASSPAPLGTPEPITNDADDLDRIPDEPPPAVSGDLDSPPGTTGDVERRLEHEFEQRTNDRSREELPPTAEMSIPAPDTTVEKRGVWGWLKKTFGG